MTGRSKHAVELALHVLPNPVAPRSDNHATANVARFGQLSRADDLLVPFREIFAATRTDCGFFARCHRRERIKRAWPKWLAAFCNLFLSGGVSILRYEN